MTSPAAPTVDVHAHVLLPEVDALVTGLPGHAEARELDARRNGPAALTISGPMVRDADVPGLMGRTMTMLRELP